VTIDKVSLTWREYVDLVTGGQPEVAQMLDDVLTGLGATAEDVTVAQGNGYSDDGYVVVGATRVAGADGEQLLQMFVQNLIDGAPLYNEGMSASAEPATLGDRQVTVVTTTLGSSTIVDRQYLYRVGDAVFTVKGTSDALIAEAVRRTP